MSKPRQHSTMPAALQAALEHHRAGRLAQAEAMYLKLPNHPDALNLAGVVAYETGRPLEAIELIRKAVRLNPGDATYQYHLGLAYTALGRLDEARAAYQAAVARNPRYIDAYNNLGVLWRGHGRPDEAIACFQKVIALDPAYVAAHASLGAALTDAGRFEEALSCCLRALALDPNHGGALGNLAATLSELKRYDEAIACARKAIALDPSAVDAYNNLGGALKEQGKLEEAEACYRQAIALRPATAELHFNLGSLLATIGKPEEAIASLEHALALAPGLADASNSLGSVLLGQARMEEAIVQFERAIQDQAARPMALNNLGNALLYQGRLDQAIAHFEQALKEGADPRITYSNLLFSHNYHPTLAADAIFAVYRRWDAEQALPLANALPPLPNQPDRAARLKVGYVSGDFRNHSVIHFAGPLLQHHDHAQVEVFCYHNSFAEDDQTRRIMGYADHWIACRALDDEQLAQRIRADGIDVLVDLSGHTLDNRLLAFARKPAPVQVSWMGFGYTTGLSAMDYFIGDDLFTPPGCEALFSETVVRLPCAPWAYQPQAEAPEPSPSPARARGYVTFACVSATTRINDVLIAAWAAILRRLPQARLRLDTGVFRDESMRRDYASRFTALGVPAAQLEIGFTSPVWRVYQDADIVLDCFPHNSGTTTVEALWMGLPVVSLADRPSVGRFGASILRAIGKEQWLAASVDEYVECAVALAEDFATLEQERAGLRAAMRASSLLDHSGFARTMESAYRSLWERWCASQSASDHERLLTALAHHQAGRLAEADALYASLPASADALHLRGMIALREGQHAQAARHISEAIAADGSQARYYCNLGNAQQALGQFEDAAASCQRALAIEPDLVAAHFNLGNARHAQMHFNAAIDSFLAALELQPEQPLAHNNLGLVLKDVGKLDDALICFRNALALMPDDVNANSNLLYCMNHHPALPPEDIFAAYQEWNAQQAAPFAGHLPPALPPAVRDGQRRLKVAYLAADLRHACVTDFAAPLLQHHDREQAEVFFYYDGTEHAADTERIAAAVDHAIPCMAMSDDELAARIRADGIDVLVDISGHVPGNRLLVFARRPAPVQVSWLGLGYTTGLTAIDYFIGDERLTPPGAEAWFSETIYRLPRAPWSYQPRHEAPEPGPLPARARGYVTFACTGASARLNTGVIETWAAILRRLPNARLRLDTRTFSDPDLCREFEARFAAHGVAPHQLQIGYTAPVWPVYQDADIVLDPFPHNCGSATVEALWMGLPVVSVLARPSVGRFGASILGALGKEHWAAPDAAAYVELAVALAQDIEGLERERRTLRDAMRASPLLDHAGFARAMEAAYRAMWQQWCQSGSAT